MKNPLKYSDYKKQQGLYLQREYGKYYEIEKDEEIFCMRMYAQYLYIIGFDNSNVLHYITIQQKKNDLIAKDIVGLIDDLFND